MTCWFTMPMQLWLHPLNAALLVLVLNNIINITSSVMDMYVMENLASFPQQFSGIVNLERKMAITYKMRFLEA